MRREADVPTRRRHEKRESAPGHEGVRKDRFLVPLNTDYDLYSMGKDGESTAPLTARQSRDDIIRADNGGFIGLASEF